MLLHLYIYLLSSPTINTYLTYCNYLFYLLRNSKSIDGTEMQRSGGSLD